MFLWGGLYEGGKLRGQVREEKGPMKLPLPHGLPICGGSGG